MYFWLCGSLVNCRFIFGKLNLNQYLYMQTNIGVNVVQEARVHPNPNLAVFSQWCWSQRHDGHKRVWIFTPWSHAKNVTKEFLYEDPEKGGVGRPLCECIRVSLTSEDALRYWLWTICQEGLCVGNGAMGTEPSRDRCMLQGAKLQGKIYLAL